MRIIDWSADVCSSDLIARGSMMSGNRSVLKSDKVVNAIDAVNTLPSSSSNEVKMKRQTIGGRKKTMTRLMDFRTEDRARQAISFLRNSATRSEERRVGKACVSTCR